MNEKHDKLDLSDPFFSYENQLKRFNDLNQTLYLIFDYPYKYYTFKLFEV